MSRSEWRVEDGLGRLRGSDDGVPVLEGNRRDLPGKRFGPNPV